MAAPQISAPATSSIGEEGALLQRAREALGRGRFDAAEQAIAEHRRRFVVGQLIEEREALWIRVLAGRGELQRAQAAAERFRHGYPRSILLPVVDEALRRGP